MEPTTTRRPLRATPTCLPRRTWWETRTSKALAGVAWSVFSIWALAEVRCTGLPPVRCSASTFPASQPGLCQWQGGSTGGDSWWAGERRTTFYQYGAEGRGQSEIPHSKQATTRSPMGEVCSRHESHTPARTSTSSTESFEIGRRLATCLPAPGGISHSLVPGDRSFHGETTAGGRKAQRSTVGEHGEPMGAGVHREMQPFGGRASCLHGKSSTGFWRKFGSYAGGCKHGAEYTRGLFCLGSFLGPRTTLLCSECTATCAASAAYTAGCLSRISHTNGGSYSSAASSPTWGWCLSGCERKGRWSKRNCEGQNPASTSGPRSFLECKTGFQEECSEALWWGWFECERSGTTSSGLSTFGCPAGRVWRTQCRSGEWPALTSREGHSHGDARPLVTDAEHPGEQGPLLGGSCRLWEPEIGKEPWWSVLSILKFSPGQCSSSRALDPAARRVFQDAFSAVQWSEPLYIHATMPFCVVDCWPCTSSGIRGLWIPGARGASDLSDLLQRRLHTHWSCECVCLPLPHDFCSAVGFASAHRNFRWGPFEMLHS